MHFFVYWPLSGRTVPLCIIGKKYFSISYVRTQYGTGTQRNFGAVPYGLLEVFGVYGTYFEYTFFDFMIENFHEVKSFGIYVSFSRQDGGRQKQQDAGIHQLQDENHPTGLKFLI